MRRYLKGARSERELLGKLHDAGYSVIRSAGSGVNSLGPDIIALKDAVCISFECKAWERPRLSLDKEGYAKLSEWKRNTGFPAYVAWRMNGMGWLFITLEEFKGNENSYSITRKKAMDIGRTLENVINDASHLRVY